MKIRVWNAFASNNSGSYTIVGRFVSEEAARAVARELAPIMAAHTAWYHAEGEKAKVSPLEEYAKSVGLPWTDADQWWPEYSSDNTPRMAVAGQQLVLHHEYTVGLPRFFGHYFYSKGGVVESMLDHAHNSLIVTFEVWWIHGKVPLPQILEHAQAAAAELADVLSRLSKEGVAPAVSFSAKAMEAPLRVAAVFDDLVIGFASVYEVLARHGAKVVARVLESEQIDDPLVSFRS